MKVVDVLPLEHMFALWQQWGFPEHTVVVGGRARGLRSHLRREVYAPKTRSEMSGSIKIVGECSEGEGRLG